LTIESPITKVLPDLLELEELMPINENAGFINSSVNVDSAKYHKAYKRVIREIIDVNNDFHSLRTVITPSTSGKMDLFNFVMYPNDGAFCSLPLIGRIIIPPTYPTNPPVFHLFTRTNRSNLDVYRNYVNN
jgi:ubiquitin-protein ligase